MESSVNNLCSTSYRLSLSNGSNWWITGDRDRVGWIDELAAIMELRECSLNGSPKLIFTRLSGLGEAGWSAYDYRTIRIWRQENSPDIVCDVKDIEYDAAKYISMRCSLQPIYQGSIDSGGLPLHAALAELDGRGILLAAAGGTGKSTCYRRLPDYWKPLCDDEALVVLNEQREYRVHPFPTWTDYIQKRAEGTWAVQYSVPLSGVFFLEQSEFDEVIPIGEAEAALRMNASAIQSCWRYWSAVDKKAESKFTDKLLDNACAMAKVIPGFRLRASLHGQFWKKIEEAIGA